MAGSRSVRKLARVSFVPGLGGPGEPQSDLPVQVDTGGPLHSSWEPARPPGVDAELCVWWPWGHGTLNLSDDLRSGSLDGPSTPGRPRRPWNPGLTVVQGTVRSQLRGTNEDAECQRRRPRASPRLPSPICPCLPLQPEFAPEAGHEALRKARAAS